MVRTAGARRPTALATICLSVALCLPLASLASEPGPQQPSDEVGTWPTAAELRATLVGLGYELRADGSSSRWSGAGFWTGARSDLTDLPSASEGRWLRVDMPDQAAARVRLSVANDARVSQLLDVGSVLGIPQSALDEAIALVRVSAEWPDEPVCPFFEWDVSGGRMVLWRDHLAGDADFEIAFQPPQEDASPGTRASDTAAIPESAVEACGALLTVEAGDLWFRPAAVTVASMKTSTITLENTGRVVHNITIDELGVQTVVTAGGSGEVVLVDPGPGVYEFYCSISGHREAGMVGSLIVE